MDYLRMKELEILCLAETKLREDIKIKLEENGNYNT